MKYASCACALVLLFALGAQAQDTAVSPSPSFARANIPESGLTATTAPDGDAPRGFASAQLLPDASFGETAGTSTASSGSPAPQIGVVNVEPSFSYQAYLGYTFVRVYAFPAREVNRNGLDLSLSYFIKRGLFGFEGAFTGAFGSVANERSDFIFYGGGPRFRVSGPRGLELWAHGLAGGVQFGPRIAGYDQGGVAYEVGGGVDIKATQRLAYRLEADMIGTRLYNSSQYSPKISAGIIYKF